MKQSGADRDSPTCQVEQPRQGPGWQGCCPGAPLPTPTQWSPHILQMGIPRGTHGPPPLHPRWTLPNRAGFPHGLRILFNTVPQAATTGTAASPALETHPPSWAGWGSGKPSPPLPSRGFQNTPCPFGSRGSTLTQPPRAMGGTCFGATPVPAVLFHRPPTLG